MSEKQRQAEKLAKELLELDRKDTSLPLKRALTKDLEKLNLATLQGLLDILSILKEQDAKLFEQSVLGWETVQLKQLIETIEARQGYKEWLTARGKEFFGSKDAVVPVKT